MARRTGKLINTTTGEETVRAFVPYPLPPKRPVLSIDGDLAELHTEALKDIEKLELAGEMVPSVAWFLHGFVRKEALISSQIEGTQATLQEVVAYEATSEADSPADVEEVCNYVDAMNYARREISRPKGLPISRRLLCNAHKRLMKGVRGAEREPGKIRTSQNWIGGTRPGNAAFVPPPPGKLDECLGDLERWVHSDDPLPPLVRAGLAHVQFETIHPFLDGNGRVGRLLITLLLEHWSLLNSPLLYLSHAFKNRQDEYYRRLSSVRADGDWEGWTRFFLECVSAAARDGVKAASAVFRLVEADRSKVLAQKTSTLYAVRLLDTLPTHPVITLGSTVKLLDTTKPTASKAIQALQEAGVLQEISGRKRDRAYAYTTYLETLAG